MAENKNSKKGKNGKEEKFFESSSFGPFLGNHFQPKKNLGFLIRLKMKPPKRAKKG